MVENEILSILRQRFEDCMLYEAPDHAVKCKDILANYENAAENWFVKCKEIPTKKKHPKTKLKSILNFQTVILEHTVNPMLVT